MSSAEPARSPAAALMPVFRLIYRSRARIAAEAFDAELGNILRVARAKNGALGITGALLVYDNWFAQTLEGDADAVKALYQRIAKDPRHDSVELRAEDMVSERVFSRWAMAKVSEHGDADIPLAASASGVVVAGARRSTPEQESVLDRMRMATRGYGRGS